MRNGNLAQLGVAVERLKDPFHFIEQLAEGRRVLNVGAAGGVEGYLPDGREGWLHDRLGRCALDLVGIDIDRENIDLAARYGVCIEREDCEEMCLDRRFELIVLSDVLEHLASPQRGVANLLKHLEPDGRLVITTPNGTAGNIVLRAILGRAPNVYYDHRAIYYPEHVQALCDRLGCRLTQIRMFDHIDRRNRVSLLKSHLFRLMTICSARLASSMLVVLEK